MVARNIAIAIAAVMMLKWSLYNNGPDKSSSYHVAINISRVADDMSGLNVILGSQFHCIQKSRVSQQWDREHCS